MRDDDVRGYVKKYLGKYSHVENALVRAKRDWAQEGDQRHKDADVKKLWTIYYCSKIKTRRFHTNTGKRTKEAQAKPAALIKEMNNPTAEKKPQLIKHWIIPRAIKNNPAFTPMNGRVDKESREWQLIQNYLSG